MAHFGGPTHLRNGMIKWFKWQKYIENDLWMGCTDQNIPDKLVEGEWKGTQPPGVCLTDDELKLVNTIIQQDYRP